jgi:hypothetical protein
VIVGQVVGFVLLIGGTTNGAWSRHMAFHMDEDIDPEPEDA